MATATKEPSLNEVCGQYKLKKKSFIRMDGARAMHSVALLTHDNDEYVKSGEHADEEAAYEDVKRKVLAMPKPMTQSEKLAEVEVLRKKLEQYEKKDNKNK